MGVLKQQITEDHIKLVRQIIFTDMDNVIFAADEDGSPFGGTNIYEDIDLILVGAPEGKIDPFAEPKPLSDEKIETYKALYKDLPNVMEIIMQRASFEVGFYKRRTHIRRGGWEKYTPAAKKYGNTTIVKK
jgi:hypothetical protein